MYIIVVVVFVVVVIQISIICFIWNVCDFAYSLVYEINRRSFKLFGSETDRISLLILLLFFFILLVGGNVFRKSLGVCRFKSDRDEIMQ